MKGLDISLEDSIIVSLAEIIFLFIKCLKKKQMDFNSDSIWFAFWLNSQRNTL